jgi:3-oxoacyl-[acyl-carrier-protein] synthase II
LIATHTRNRAVITGMGILAANGTGIEEFWRTLLAGESGIGPITLFDASDLACRIAGEVKGFDPATYIEPELKPKRMGRFTQLGVAAARMAVKHAGLDPKALKALPQLPVVMGVSTSAMDLFAVEPRIHTAVSSVPHAVGSAIAYGYDLTARLITISNGCASSLDAVALGAQLIRSGQSDVVIAGGADAAVTHYVFDGMLKCRKCCTRNDDPQHASRPFDRHRDYGVLAEGAGIVILENLEHARARGATLYGEITGYGTCADPPDAEEGGGLARAMTQAMANAGCRPQDIQYVLAHGPSDMHMDITETRMIKEALGERAYAVPVTSIKGATGCPMGVGGVHEVIAAALTFSTGWMPPTANYQEPDPECDLDYVPGRARRAVVDHALINTHGFGRGNSCLTLSRVE